MYLDRIPTLGKCVLISLSPAVDYIINQSWSVNRWTLTTHMDVSRPCRLSALSGVCFNFSVLKWNRTKAGSECVFTGISSRTHQTPGTSSEQHNMLQMHLTTEMCSCTRSDPVRVSGLVVAAHDPQAFSAFQLPVKFYSDQTEQSDLVIVIESLA